MPHISCNVSSEKSFFYRRVIKLGLPTTRAGKAEKIYATDQNVKGGGEGGGGGVLGLTITLDESEKTSKTTWLHISLYSKEKLSVNQALSCPAGWTELIQGPFKRHVLSGGHFYFMERDNERSVINLVSAALGVL